MPTPNDQSTTYTGTARRDEEDRLARRRRAELTEEQWEMHERLAQLDAAARHAEEDRLLEEMARHLPGVAPAIRAVTAHLIEQRAADVGSCCEGRAPA